MPTDPFAAYRRPATAPPDATTAPPATDPFAAYRRPSQPAVAAPATPPDRGVLGTAAEVSKGVLKGTVNSLAGLGEMLANAGMLPGVQPSLLNETMRHPVFTRAEEATTAKNTPQAAGKGLAFVAEMALPTGKLGKAALDAIPSAARAAGKFQDVMGAARQVPVDIEAPGTVALRIAELAERGGSMPMAVNKFLRRVTDPAKTPLDYEEARDFASNISRLSANEFQRLTPTVAREVAGLRVALNKAVGDAAAKAGKGKEYADAMTEYAKAKRLEGMIDDVVTGAKRAAPYAGAAGAATWLTSKMLGLLGKD